MSTPENRSHPTAEELVAHVYGELTPAARDEVSAHLRDCPQCRAQAEDWHATMAQLDQWRLEPRRRLALPQPMLQWGLAALFMLGLGLGIGRLTAPAPIDAVRLRAELLPALRQELRQEIDASTQTTLASSVAESRRLVGDLAQAWSTTRAQDQQTTLALYSDAEQRRKAELAWLRRDLETVAVFADERLENTQSQIGQLARVSQAYWDGRSP